MNYLSQLKVASLSILGIATLYGCSNSNKSKSDIKTRPNFLILMSDNQCWTDLGCYGNPALKTPHIDKLAKQGVQFSNAFCGSPSSTPARASMLTGQEMWRLEEGANLWGILPSKFPVYTDMLEKSGYLVGFEGKGWGPGEIEGSGRTRNPGGDNYQSFEEFYNEREEGQPFLYWFCSRNPHRPYKRDAGKKAGIDLNKIKVPQYLPNVPEVKEDIADYYSEIQSFDREVGSYLELLKEMGQLENTIIIVLSDNGWQMPRGLANLYDAGTHIPMIVINPKRIKGGRVVDDYVSMNDLAPTILEYAQLQVPQYMTAKSLCTQLKSDKSGIINKSRNFIVTGRERHAYVRKNGDGYGARAIRTEQYLYIKNYNPERWPAGDPPLYGDVDANMLQYPCGSKMYMLENHDKLDHHLFDLSFGKRPAEELYDLSKDPDEIHNLADDQNYAQIKKKLSKQMVDYLVKTNDPRETHQPMKWSHAKYFAEKDLYPRPCQDAIDRLHLEEEYSYTEQ